MPIIGYKDGIDYDVACRMCHAFAREHGWSSSEKKRSKRLFDYEFSMSKLGARDSNNPALAIAVGYSGGRKTVELRRRGKWTAYVTLNDTGNISSGCFDGETGIDDLIMLKNLYNRVIIGGIA